MLLETIGMKKEDLPETMMKEIHEIIEECGGNSEYSLSKEEMSKIMKEKKEEKKRKRQVPLVPLDEDNWRHLAVCSRYIVDQ